ncbi:ead/Ea22-like family protein [Citrobacter braakii]|uniref:ead/Ea22-like family protein n=1 Tax=Citrobacter braakii TaxID=57706 RepID=UPI00351D2D12
MTALNKYAALREAAEKAKAARARLESMPDEDVVLFEDDDIKSDVYTCNKFIVTANPATVLALLDENLQLQRDKDSLEAAEKRNAELTEFIQHIKKCLVKNGEYAPLSHETIDTILGIRADGKGAAL